MKLTVHFDGACSMKRCIAAGGAVLYDEHGAEIATRARFLRDVTTPVAEYTALHLGLELARQHAGVQASQTDVVALGDAELVVYQVDGTYVCRKPHLKALLGVARLLMEPFASCDVRVFPKAGPQHKRRFGNSRADEIAGQCMDRQEDTETWTDPR